LKDHGVVSLQNVHIRIVLSREDRRAAAWADTGRAITQIQRNIGVYNSTAVVVVRDITMALYDSSCPGAGKVNVARGSDFGCEDPCRLRCSSTRRNVAVRRVYYQRRSWIWFYPVLPRGQPKGRRAVIDGIGVE